MLNIRDVEEGITADIELDEYEHYMIKEICEQKTSIENTMGGRIDYNSELVYIDELSKVRDKLIKAKRFWFLACGTSHFATLATYQFFRKIIDEEFVRSLLAQVFIDNEYAIDEDDVVFFVSQSGQTADTIEALRYCRKRGATCVGIINTPFMNTIGNECDVYIRLNAGIEKAVASTKAFTSQMVAIMLAGMQIAQWKNINSEYRSHYIKMFKNFPEKVQETIDRQIPEEIIELLLQATGVLITGRGEQIPICYEGALKIKEITYIHAEGISSGEMKHGSLALISKDNKKLPVIMIIYDDKYFSKSLIGYNQISSKGMEPYVICPDTIKHHFINTVTVPTANIDANLADKHEGLNFLQGILHAIVLQKIAYYVAIGKGNNPDFPRNLAKSVTVE